MARPRAVNSALRGLGASAHNETMRVLVVLAALLLAGCGSAGVGLGIGAVVKVTKPGWDKPGSFEVALHPWPITSPTFKAAQYFGTRGFFHDLVDPKTPAKPRGGTTGQWGGAYPQHEVGIAVPIDETLAGGWAKLASVELTGDLKADGKLTRGEFLNRLYARIHP